MNRIGLRIRAYNLQRAHRSQWQVDQRVGSGDIDDLEVVAVASNQDRVSCRTGQLYDGAIADLPGGVLDFAGERHPSRAEIGLVRDAPTHISQTAFRAGWRSYVERVGSACHRGVADHFLASIVPVTILIPIDPAV